MSETCNYYKIIKVQREIEHPVNVILYMSNKLTLSDSQNVRDRENGHLYGAMTVFIVFIIHTSSFPFQKWPNAYFFLSNSNMNFFTLLEE